MSCGNPYLSAAKEGHCGDVALLLYDRDCGFCRWCVGVLLAWDRRRRLFPVTIQGETGAAALEGMSPDDRLRSWHLVDDSGHVWSGGAAFPALGLLLPGGRVLAVLAGLSPGATERVYRLLADNRRLLSRLVPASSKRRADERIRRRVRDGVAREAA
jgi:predicted DCC family thiol-disulfide oxidoreductase YuxK